MAPRRKTSKATGRADGPKVKFLTVLPPEVIKALKLQAIQRGTTASALLEAAVADWMKKHRKSPPPPRAEMSARAPQKRQFLSRMNADLVRQLKILAMDWRVTASALIGEAVQEWQSQQATDPNPGTPP